MEKIPNRELEYTPDFKELIAQNPGALKSFLKLEKEIKNQTASGELDPKERKIFSDGDVSVSPLYEMFEKHGEWREELNDYLKVDVAGESFFCEKN